jgi:hypothetical protein
MNVKFLVFDLLQQFFLSLSDVVTHLAGCQPTVHFHQLFECASELLLLPEQLHLQLPQVESVSLMSALSPAGLVVSVQCLDATRELLQPSAIQDLPYLQIHSQQSYLETQEVCFGQFLR